MAFAQAEANPVVNAVVAVGHGLGRETVTTVAMWAYAFAHPISLLSGKLATWSYDWLVKPRSDIKEYGKERLRSLSCRI